LSDEHLTSRRLAAPPAAGPPATSEADALLPRGMRNRLGILSNRRTGDTIQVLTGRAGILEAWALTCAPNSCRRRCALSDLYRVVGPDYDADAPRPEDFPGFRCGRAPIVY